MRSTSRPTTTTMDETNDIIVESVTQSNSLSKSISDSKHMDMESTSQLMNDSVRTPTVPLANITRINPFANKSSTKTPLMMMSSNDAGGGGGEENSTPKSVLNMIEDKLIKRSASTATSQSGRDKDAWKPTPNRKLVKSKVSSGTPTIGSFFNN